MLAMLAGLCLAFWGAVSTGPVRAQALPAMQAVEVHGQTLRYYEAGKGPTLVLVHGFGSNAKFDWGEVIPELAKDYHVVALDQIGFGSSDKPQISYGVQTFVDMLDAFLKAKGIGKFSLVGESFGGWVVAAYTIEALGDPAMPVPDKLILADAAGLRPEVASPPPAMDNSLSLAGTRAGLGTVFHDKTILTDAFVKEAFETRMRESSGYTQDSLIRNMASARYLDEDLAKITIPTLVVWGGEDQIVPLSAGKRYAAGIKGAALVVIPGCGHVPATERPADFLAAVRGFL